MMSQRHSDNCKSYDDAFACSSDFRSLIFLCQRDVSGSSGEPASDSSPTFDRRILCEERKNSMLIMRPHHRKIFMLVFSNHLCNC